MLTFYEWKSRGSVTQLLALQVKMVALLLPDFELYPLYQSLIHSITHLHFTHIGYRSYIKIIEKLSGNERHG